jgi:3-deoxy-D-manno-octulosonic-acid transferase
MAPRHPDRFGEVEALIRGAGFEVARRSQGEKWRENAIFLLDSVGELGDFYALGDAAFVGGSLIRRGGHNLLEPILRGVPVCFGPHVNNFLAQRDLLLKHELGAQIEAENVANWLDLLAENRGKFAWRVEAALEPHRGAAAAMAREIGARVSESAENS